MRNEIIGMSAIESINAIHHQERLRNKSSLTAKVLEKSRPYRMSENLRS